MRSYCNGEDLPRGLLAHIFIIAVAANIPSVSIGGGQIKTDGIIETCVGPVSARMQCASKNTRPQRLIE